MRQLGRLYRWGNQERDLAPLLRLLLLVGLACVLVGLAAGIPEILVTGLLVIFFMVPVVYLREKALQWIRDRLGRERKGK
jgi:hypothetical protein